MLWVFTGMLLIECHNMFSWQHMKISVLWKKASYSIRDSLQPLYNTVCYNAVLDITRFKDGSQKYIDYIENFSI